MSAVDSLTALEVMLTYRLKLPEPPRYAAGIVDRARPAIGLPTLFGVMDTLIGLWEESSLDLLKMELRAEELNAKEVS